MAKFVSLESTIRSLGAKSASQPLEKDMNDQIYVGSYRSKNFEVSRPAQKLFASLPKGISVDLAQKIAEYSDKLFDIHKKVAASERASSADKETAETLHKTIMALAGEVKMPKAFDYAEDSLNFIKGKHKEEKENTEQPSPDDIAKLFATPPKDYQSDVKSDSDIDNISKFRIARDIKAQRKLKIIDDEYHPEETQMTEPLVDEEIVTTGQRGTNIPSGPMFRGRSPVKNAAFNYGGDGNISSYVERLNKKTGDITATSQTALTQGSKNSKQTYTDSITSVTNPAKPGVDNMKSNRTLVTKQVRTEAKEPNMTLHEKKKMTKADIAALEDPKGTIDANDFAALRAGKHKTMKEEKATYCGACGKIHTKGKCNMKEEIELDEVLDTLPKMVNYVSAHNKSQTDALAKGDKGTVRKRERGAAVFKRRFAQSQKGLKNEEFEHIDEMFSEIALFAAERFGSNDIGEKVAVAIVNKLYEELEPLFEASGEYVTMKKVNRKKTVRNNPALIGKYKSMGWVILENQITFDERLDQIFEAIEVTKRSRGRPRKNPIVAVDPNAAKRPRGRPKKVADASTTAGKEDLKNPNTLHLNLKRAADQGELGNVQHTFANGDTATINPGHAKQFMARHSQIKSSDAKDALLRHAHSSPRAFMSMVKGETAPSETKKGIALGGSARLKALLGKED